MPLRISVKKCTVLQVVVVASGLVVILLGSLIWVRWAYSIFFVRDGATFFANYRTAMEGLQSDLLLSVPNDTITGQMIQCTVTSDVRGNLGPPSVLLNDGRDWIRDRWQAASDMHGTNIEGTHWVQLDWKQATNNNKPQSVIITRIVLDWEAAYADHYDVQIRHGGDTDASSWETIVSSPAKATMIRVSQSGQSPGVKSVTPLHVVHDIPLLPLRAAPSSSKTASSLRIWIRESAKGWGVSLWQVQVYGHYYPDD